MYLRAPLRDNTWKHNLTIPSTCCACISLWRQRRCLLLLCISINRKTFSYTFVCVRVPSRSLSFLHWESFASQLRILSKHTVCTLLVYQNQYVCAYCAWKWMFISLYVKQSLYLETFEDITKLSAIS